MVTSPLSEGPISRGERALIQVELRENVELTHGVSVDESTSRLLPGAPLSKETPRRLSARSPFVESASRASRSRALPRLAPLHAKSRKLRLVEDPTVVVLNRPPSTRHAWPGARSVPCSLPRPQGPAALATLAATRTRPPSAIPSPRYVTPATQPRGTPSSARNDWAYKAIRIAAAVCHLAQYFSLFGEAALFGFGMTWYASHWGARGTGPFRATSASVSDSRGQRRRRRDAAESVGRRQLRMPAPQRIASGRGLASARSAQLGRPRWRAPVGVTSSASCPRRKSNTVQAATSPVLVAAARRGALDSAVPIGTGSKSSRRQKCKAAAAPHIAMARRSDS